MGEFKYNATKFKVGDRVRIISIDGGVGEFYKLEELIDRTATIVDIDDEYEYPYELKIDDLEPPYPELFAEHELELEELE